MNRSTSTRSIPDIFKEFLDSLQHESTYRFSSPWRPRGSSSIVVPVIKELNGKGRDYVTLQESSHVTLQDTGRIGGVKVTNAEQVPVFVRIGSVFKGIGTQSRAANKSMFIEPGESIDIDVNCVHASHNISSGSTFGYSADSSSPAYVEIALLQRQQQHVWRRVAAYSAARARRAGTPIANSSGRTGQALEQSGSAYDKNLAEEVNLNDNFAKLIEQLLTKIPNHENQVGLVVIDEKGIFGLEMFDSLESRKTLNKGTILKFGELLVRQINESVVDIKVNEQKVREKIHEFISAMKSIKITCESSARSSRINIDHRAILGEAIFRGIDFIHFTAIRKDSIDFESSVKEGD